MKFYFCYLFIVIILLNTFLPLKTFMRNKVGSRVKSKQDKTIFKQFGESTFKPMRIRFVHVDSSFSSEWKSALTTEEYNAFEQKIINPINKFFQKMLKVYPLDDTAIKTADNCSTKVEDEDEDEPDDDIKLTFKPEDYLVGYDFVFFLKFKPFKGSALAKAVHCSIAKIANSYRRPVMGLITMNSKTLDDLTDPTKTAFNGSKRTLFHEMTHALAFNSSLFKYFITADGQPVPRGGTIKSVDIWNGSSQEFIHAQGMKDQVAKYFECADDNNGLAANGKVHFHQQIILNQIMKPVADGSQGRISVFMLTLYDLTGWYIVDLSLAEEILWGRGKGCDFANLKCKDKNGKLFDEYCNNSSSTLNYGCDYYYEQKAYCALNRKAECSYMMPSTACNRSKADTDDYRSYEFFGNDGDFKGKCFEYFNSSKDRRSLCLKSKCNQEERSITVYADDKEYKAVYSDKTPSSTTFTHAGTVINFPADFDRFCFNIFNPRKDNF